MPLWSGRLPGSVHSAEMGLCRHLRDRIHRWRRTRDTGHRQGRLPVRQGRPQRAARRGAGEPRCQTWAQSVQVSPVAPPRMFNAGSILERQSRLMSPAEDTEFAMAFIEPEISGRELEIALAFHMMEQAPAARGRARLPGLADYQ